MSTKITKQMRTETSHLLPGHPGRCRNLHGHSYLWEVSLEADQLMLNGMVEDFGDLKKVMETIIDPFDHAFVYFTGDNASCKIAEALEGVGATRLIGTDYLPTAENFAQQVWYQMKQRYPALKRITVRVWETVTSWAEYTDPE